MKKSVLVAALAALVTLNAHAQDRAKGEFSHGGEFRVRDIWNMNENLRKDEQPNSRNTISQRFKLDLGFKATEKLAANMTLLSNLNWGKSTAETANTPDGSSGTGDFLTVNQAYANWMISDDFTLKVGRMNYQIADGSLIGINDYQAVPYAFEGLLGNYEAAFGRIQVLTFKFRQIGYGTPAGATTAGNVTSSDAEHNVYGLNFDLKTMPEMIKGVNVHVLKEASDAVVGNTSNLRGRDIMRYGLNASAVFAIIDFKVWYEAMNGKYKEIATGGVITNRSASGNMMQAEVGANFANFMGSRVYFRYHKDSGNKQNATDTSDSPAKEEVYDPFFYERHSAAGMMDLFQWGNLTYMTAGVTLKPMDSTDVGLAYWMFSKTEKGDSSSTPVGRAASNFTTNNEGRMTYSDTDKSKLGSEIDLWAEHRYTPNFSTMVNLGMFSPGEVFTSDTGGTRTGHSDAITQVFVQGKFTF